MLWWQFSTHQLVIALPKGLQSQRTAITEHCSHRLIIRPEFARENHCSRRGLKSLLVADIQNSRRHWSILTHFTWVSNAFHACNNNTNCGCYFRATPTCQCILLAFYQAGQNHIRVNRRGFKSKLNPTHPRKNKHTKPTNRTKPTSKSRFGGFLGVTLPGLSFK